MDAAGFWGTHSRDNKIIFHKEPIKSSLLVKKEIWRKVAKFNPNLLLCHARAASQGVGEPLHNCNNHPFVSNNRLIGLVHNGRIADQEYTALKEKYEVFSECDSEILLRVFEGAEKYKTKNEFLNFDTHIASRFSGLRDIFSLINEGHMAVAIGERDKNNRYLWLFRNVYRTLWLVDLRETLGQVFFCSTPEIWQNAVSSIEDSYIGKSQKLIELPPQEIWFFKITADNPYVDKAQRFNVDRGSENAQWGFEGERLPINRQIPEVETICKLDENDSLIKGPRLPGDVPYDIHEFQMWCRKIKEKVDAVEVQALVMTQEASITFDDFKMALEGLKDSERELDGTLRLLEVDNDI